MASAMPITHSAKKKLRADQRKTGFNLAVKTKVKKAVKKARKESTPKVLRDAWSLLDRAAKNKVIHKNKANRLKSRLAKLATAKPGKAK